MIPKEKAAMPPPACLPLHQPSVFPGCLIQIANAGRSPENSEKSFKPQISLINADLICVFRRKSAA
jgi:hypothetical protein